MMRAMFQIDSFDIVKTHDYTVQYIYIYNNMLYTVQFGYTMTMIYTVYIY